MGSNEYEEISTIYVSETAKALLIDEGNNKFWIPISLINNPEAFDQARYGTPITIEVERWFLEKEGIL